MQMQESLDFWDSERGGGRDPLDPPLDPPMKTVGVTSPQNYLQ